jgi:hypothetical protein
VVGFTTGSRGEVPGTRKSVIREQQNTIIIIIIHFLACGESSLRLAYNP